MFKKITILLFSALLMTVLMLAAGGIYLLPENFMGAYMYADVCNAVGGMFSMMIIPGFAVGYAACQSRVLGVIYYVGFVVLGFVGGISAWWIVTAVLLVLSYIFCISENVGIYDDLDIYDKLCVLVPAFGAVLFIDKEGLVSYKGTFRENLYHGKGIYTRSDGQSFLALWENGEPVRTEQTWAANGSETKDLAYTGCKEDDGFILSLSRD